MTLWNRWCELCGHWFLLPARTRFLYLCLLALLWLNWSVNVFGN